MPASLPVRPGGRVVSMPVRRWVPSSRASLQDEGRVGAGLGGDRAGGEGGALGALASMLRAGAEPPAGTGVWKESAGWASAPSGADQGVRSGGGVGAAGRRGDQGGAGAVEEVEVEVFERQLGVFVEGRASAGRLRVGVDLAGELGDDPALRVFDRQVDREQGAEGVLRRAWRGRPSSGELVVEQRGGHFAPCRAWRRRGSSGALGEVARPALRAGSRSGPGAGPGRWPRRG